MEIEIPFGAKDSELKEWRYTIPEGYTAEIKGGEIIVKLAESKDERIRKTLIGYFNTIAGDYYGELKKSDILAWLEKQKEQKPKITVKIPKFRVGDIIQHVPLESWDRTKKIKAIDKDGYYTDASHLGDNGSGGFIGFSFEDEYELVKQKPQIFIPKFRVGDKVISTKNEHLTYNVLEVGHINELGNPDYKVEIFTDGKADNNVKFIECQKMDEWGKLIEQKPADDKAFEEWVDGWWEEHKDKVYHEVAMDKKEFKNFCRGIRNMYQQNPTEWSEENEKMKNECIRILSENCAGNSIYITRAVDWLKSLQKRFGYKTK